MNTKKLISTAFAISLLLVSCGPKPLSDVDFSAAAQSVCEKLHTDSEPLDKFDLEGRATAYRQAAEALAALNITEKSAPKGTQLRSGLSELTDSFDKFSKAVAEAFIKANLKAPVAIILTEDGHMLGYTNTGRVTDVLHATALDVDPSIFSNIKANQLQVQEAATSLGLGNCIVPWIEK